MATTAAAAGVYTDSSHRWSSPSDRNSERSAEYSQEPAVVAVETAESLGRVTVAAPVYAPRGYQN